MYKPYIHRNLETILVSVLVKISFGKKAKVAMEA